jgi:histidinol-phosphatase
LSEATFSTTNPARWLAMGKRDAYEGLLSSVQLARGWGDCYGHILVATGRADVMIDPAMNAWDAAALLPIMQEAGGHFVDWTGNATIYGGNGLSVVECVKPMPLGLGNPDFGEIGLQFAASRQGLMDHRRS